MQPRFHSRSRAAVPFRPAPDAGVLARVANPSVVGAPEPHTLKGPALTVRPVLRPPQASKVVQLDSADGAVTFDLRRRPSGVVMTRTRRQARHRCVVQQMHLSEEASLVRWCERDQLRFVYPLLFANLRRSGCALFHVAS